MDYKNICSQLIKSCKEVGEFIRIEKDNFTQDKVETKNKNDFVSYVDKEAEKKLVKLLSEIIPDSGFITEEGTIKQENKKHTWIIDPLDGTTNFIHACPPFCISVALMENNELVCGVVYEIFFDECFSAYKGGKAYLNGNEINVTKVDKVANSLIVTGFPHELGTKFDKFLNSFQYFTLNSHGVRRLGSAAADLVYVACGRMDAFYQYNLSPWDVAAGAFIVKQAGGEVTDFSGGDNYVFGKEIVATSKTIHEEFIGTLNNLFFSKSDD
jgi:myo-inositol-1(or 4)-monophosphatase